jgi:APA family basic amino acid/polyamine antiporter
MAQLQRTFGLWSSVSLVVGGIVGSAIFMKPALMAAQVGSPFWLLVVWVAGGLITLCGALTNAEVAAMLPQTGGQYVFFQKMYGDFVAFLYGWAAFAVFNTAGVASIAYVFAMYAEYFVALPRLAAQTELYVAIPLPAIGTLYPLQHLSVKLLTIFLIVALTWVNYRSVHAGGRVQVVFTMLKIAAIVLLVVGLLAAPAAHRPFGEAAHQPAHGWSWVLGLMAALSGAFWGYDGWNNITFIAGEIKNPQQNIPRSLLIGLLITIATYTLVVLAYLTVMPIEAIAKSGFVASDAATIAFGTAGGAIIAVLVMLSTFGTTNGNILATARVSFAMAQEKKFFAFAGRVHPVYQSPGNALWLHATWTCLLVFSGSFDMLTDMLVFVSWLFYGLSAAGVFVLRKTMPHATRPYKVWGYPYLPAAFVLFTAFFVASTLVVDIQNYVGGKTTLINSLFGLLLTAMGVPLYFYFHRKR